MSSDAYWNSVEEERARSSRANWRRVLERVLEQAARHRRGDDSAHALKQDLKFIEAMVRPALTGVGEVPNTPPEDEEKPREKPK